MNDHLRQLERRLGVEINNRGNLFNVIGSNSAAQSAVAVLKDLYSVTENEVLSPSSIHLLLQASM